jgi:hypothetical protein
MILSTSLSYATYYLIKIVPVIAIGIFAANLAVNLGLMRKFDGLIKPLSTKAKISGTSALAVVTCTFSSTAGYSMLSEGLDNKRIYEKEVIATSLISYFPGILSHLFTFFIPVVIPILGVTTGITYVVLRGFVALLKTCLGIFLARLWLNDASTLSNYPQPLIPDSTIAITADRKQALDKSVSVTYRMLKRIVPVMFITLFLVSVAMELGVFQSFSEILEPITTILGLESGIALISATEIVNTYSGMIIAGSFLDEGMISVNGVLIALMLGNVISFSTRFMKHSLPLHVSLFGPKLGGKIVTINGAATLVIDVLLVMVLLAI